MLLERSAPLQRHKSLNSMLFFGGCYFLPATYWLLFCQHYNTYSFPSCFFSNACWKKLNIPKITPAAAPKLMTFLLLILGESTCERLVHRPSRRSQFNLLVGSAVWRTIGTCLIYFVHVCVRHKIIVFSGWVRAASSTRCRCSSLCREYRRTTLHCYSEFVSVGTCNSIREGGEKRRTRRQIM